MDNGDRVIMARLEERIIAMQTDVGEIKSEIKTVKGCINNTEKFAVETRTMLTGHLKEETKKMAGWGIGVSILAIIVSVIMKLVIG